MGATILGRLGVLLVTGIYLFVSPSFSSAAETGRLGAGVTLHAIAIDDPNGDVPNAGEAGIGLMYLDELSRDTRYYAEFSYLDAEISAESGKIGQDATRFGISTVVQMRLRQFRSFKPWLGLGIGLYQEEFTRRHTVDSAGFLTGAFPDRDVTQLVVTFDAMHEWALTKSIDLALRVKYDIGFNKGVDGLSASVILLY
ncbi:MAG: Uncharacterized protein FD165_2678 [Gammaproteobacteria bacterium]|nr:MAG: Uncharacterized protein FD165_2678 [Gammaproteobacteria bacterium]TND01151.1 MAG: Uncharacterized protein FD120_2687 [Gammaproteobacteria bacterium]